MCIAVNCYGTTSVLSSVTVHSNTVIQSEIHNFMENNCQYDTMEL